SILSPAFTRRMLEAKHGRGALGEWQKRNEKVAENAAAYEARTNHELVAPIYNYDHDVREGRDLSYNGNSLTLRGYAAIDLDMPNPYPDMAPH
ncbi:MAG: beta-ketoacyl synthase, partial [Gammaproteobacteria bacterium]